MPADRLIIRQLTVQARIGVTEAERATPQTLWIDLELAIDAAAAAAHDDMRDTIDYAQLVAAVTHTATHTTYNLLETVAEAVAATVRQQGAHGQVVVRVTKRALPGIDSAAVEVVRGPGVGRPGKS
jgi:dihydroneopterin aldolase